LIVAVGAVDLLLLSIRPWRSDSMAVHVCTPLHALSFQFVDCCCG
jgi:hypothetical protein